MNSWISFLLFASLVSHLPNGSDAQAARMAQQNQPRPQMQYECAPENYDDTYGTIGPAPPEVIYDVVRLTPDVLNRDPQHVLYERPTYAMIPKNGSLPPRATNEATHYPAYRFTAPRNAGSPDRNLSEKLLRFIRLPYQFEDGHLLECIVYNLGVEVFFLERFMEPPGVNGKVRITIRKQVVDNVEREYVDLPYLNQHNQLMLIQTWIIETHREHDMEAPRPYGFFQAINVIRSNTPINAYIHHEYEPPRYITEPKAGITGELRTRLHISWLPGLCYSLAMSGKWSNGEECRREKWIIHTLLADSLEPLEISSSNFDLLPDEEFIVPGLYDRWPSMDTFYPTRNWLARSWALHGRHMFGRARDYFATAIRMYDDADVEHLTGRLQQEGIRASHSNVYRHSNLMQRLQNIFGANRILHLNCVEAGYDLSVLFEIQICYHRSAVGQWRSDDCNPIAERQCGNNIILPRTYGAIQYLVLNVYKLPVFHHWWRSINASLLVVRPKDKAWSSSQRTGPEQKLWFVDSSDWAGWYLYGLCSSHQYRHLENIYVNHVNHLKELNYESVWEPYRVIWPAPTNDFLANVYEKCTLPLRLLNDPQLTGMNNYFTRTSHMFLALHTVNWQHDAILNRTDVALNTVEVENAFRHHVTKRVLLQCFKINGRNYLARVRICYSKVLDRISCPESLPLFRESQQEMDYRHCGQQLIIPSSPEAIYGFGQKF